MTARWLLQNYKMYCSQEQVLKYMLNQHKPMRRTNEKDIIESAIFSSKPLGLPTSGQHGTSSTEYAVGLLFDTEAEEKKNEEIIVESWTRKLQRIEFYLYLHDAVIGVLTEEERALVKLHFEDQHTIEEISRMPLTEHSYGPKSRSTLQRMLRSIETKTQKVLKVLSNDGNARTIQQEKL